MPKMKIVVEMDEAEWAEYKQFLDGTHASQGSKQESRNESRNELSPEGLAELLKEMGFEEKWQESKEDIITGEPSVGALYTHEQAKMRVYAIRRGEELE